MKIRLHFSPFATNHISRTFFRFAPMTAALLLLTLGGATLLPLPFYSAKSRASSSHTPSAQTCLKCPAPTKQIIYAPLIDLPEASSSEINLNCRSSHPIDVTPTFYKTDGTPIVGKVIQLQPSDILFVDTKSLIPEEHRGEQDWGGMSLSYTGQYMEAWAQLTLHGINGGSSVNVLFAVLNDVASNTQAAVWWEPRNGEATIALGNGSSERVHATLEFSDGESRDVDLNPFATEVITRQANQRVGQLALNGKSESVIISSTGPTGTLIVRGVVGSADGKFTGSIRFYDTKNAVQSNLYSTRFRLKNIAPHVLLKNTTAGAIVVRPRFLPESGTDPVELPAMILGPNETAEVNPAPLMAAVEKRADLDDASVQIINEGAPGSLIGALYGVDKTTGMVYDVPLRDSGPMRASAGGYPIRLERDYSTIISITNVSEVPTEFTAQVNYEGGPYLFHIHKLAAGETATFDLRKIRDEQTPDWRGHTLPASFTHGQFRWSIHGGGANARLTGRAEILSLSEQVSSSYSCGVDCANSYAHPELSYDGVNDAGQTFIIGVGASMQLYALEVDTDCYSNVYTIPLSPVWSSDDSSILSSNGGGGFTGIAPGVTKFHIKFDAPYYDCNDACRYGDNSVDAPYYTETLQITLSATGIQEVGKTNHYISLINTGNVTITATLNPSNTNPSAVQWTGGSAGSDNLHRVIGTSSASNTVVAASVVGDYPEADAVVIHVVDATMPPPALIDAPKTYSNGGTVSTNGQFGRTIFYNPAEGVNYPTYNIDAYFASDRWVFRVHNIMHTYKSAIDSLGRIDLPDGNPPNFPLVPGLTLEESHSVARSDLDITGLPAGQGPPRTKYWVQFITQNHENYHISDYYSNTYWLHQMGLFESQDVEPTTVNVIFDCLDTTTTTGAAAITKMRPTWDTAIGNRHYEAGNEYLPGAETRAYAATNPAYVPIRDAIPNP